MTQRKLAVLRDVWRRVRESALRRLGAPLLRAYSVMLAPGVLIVAACVAAAAVE